MSTAPVVISSFFPALTALLEAGTPASLTVYEKDALPKIPTPPYCTTEYYSTGYGHDDAPLTRAVGHCTVVGVAVYGVGLQQLDTLWALDQVRAVLPTIPLGVVGGVLLSSIGSQGPPSEPMQAGTLYSSREIFVCYLEAL